jgi:hypothetical protein
LSRTTRLGVGVFAFEDPLVTGHTRISVPRKRSAPRVLTKTRKGTGQ